MLFLIGVLLAIFVLPSPWGLVAIVVGGILDIVETGIFFWLSRRRRVTVGVEALVGKSGVATSALSPEGQVRLNGELWRARCEAGCDPGTKVVVREIDGLTLLVQRAEA